MSVVVADFSSISATETFVAEVSEISSKIDILILNHAWLHSVDWVDASLTRNSTENARELRKMMETSFLSYVDLVTLTLPRMASDGRVVVSSSGAGVAGVHHQAPYSAAKHAIHGFFTSLRQDLMYARSNITVTIAIIGRISTETSDEMLRGRYKYLPSFDAEDAARSIIRGALRRDRTVSFPQSQIASLRVFSMLLPSLYDSLVLLNAHSHECTNVPFEFLLIPSCFFAMQEYL